MDFNANQDRRFPCRFYSDLCPSALVWPDVVGLLPVACAAVRPVAAARAHAAAQDALVPPVAVAQAPVAARDALALLGAPDVACWCVVRALSASAHAAPPVHGARLACAAVQPLAAAQASAVARDELALPAAVAVRYWSGVRALPASAHAA